MPALSRAGTDGHAARACRHPFQGRVPAQVMNGEPRSFALSGKLSKRARVRSLPGQGAGEASASTWSHVSPPQTHLQQAHVRGLLPVFKLPTPSTQRLFWRTKPQGTRAPSTLQIHQLTFVRFSCNRKRNLMVEKARGSGVSSSSYRDANTTWKASPGGPHLHLITPQRPAS